MVGGENQLPKLSCELHTHTWHAFTRIHTHTNNKKKEEEEEEKKKKPEEEEEEGGSGGKGEEGS